MKTKIFFYFLLLVGIISCEDKKQDELVYKNYNKAKTTNTVLSPINGWELGDYILEAKFDDNQTETVFFKVVDKISNREEFDVFIDTISSNIDVYYLYDSINQTYDTMYTIKQIRISAPSTPISVQFDQYLYNDEITYYVYKECNVSMYKEN